MNRRSNLRDDDRGAILVVGLLACVLLIGVIWSVLGVGEALVFRHQAQAAADAAVFSAAVMQARAMNFIVLFNLLVAAILAVRVVLRVLQLAMVALIPFTAFASLAFIPTIESVYRSANVIINPALEGIGMAAGTSVIMAPAFARGAAKHVGSGYEPLVSRVRLTSAGQDEDQFDVLPLPLKQDSDGRRPCEKAVSALDDMVRLAVSSIGLSLLHDVMSPLLDIVRPLAGGAPFFFCGLGWNIELPEVEDIDEKIEEAEDACKDELRADPDFDGDSRDGRVALARCEHQNSGAADTGQGIVEEMLSTGISSALGLQPPMTMAVVDEWANGDLGSQPIAIVTLDSGMLRAGAAGLRRAAWGARTPGAPPEEANSALAQAEYYYDCEGGWREAGCDGPDEAMWNFRWRARLVALDPSAEPIKATVDAINQRVRSSLPGSSRDPETLGWLMGLSNYLVH